MMKEEVVNSVGVVFDRRDVNGGLCASDCLPRK